MRFFSFLTAIAFIFISCSDEDEKQVLTWSKLGLDGKTIHELKIVNNSLFAASSGGLYKKSLNTTNEFSLIGFDGKNVQAIAPISEQHILASLVDRANQDPPALYKTIDGGETWQEVQNNFRGTDQEVMLDIEMHPADDNILYGTGWQVVAKSTDQGVNWVPVWGDWGGFGTGTSVVSINPSDADHVWAGGQGGIENGYLLHSENETEWDEWYDLVENPTVVKEIVFDANNPEHVYAGFEGALMRTKNNGSSWETLIDSEENRFFFGIGLTHFDSDRIYTAGWLKRFDDPQPLKLFYSNDHGTTWKTLDFADEDFGGVYDLKIIPGEDQDRIFLGLYKGGVYEVTVPRDLE